eukprot:s460_g18.t1
MASAVGNFALLLEAMALIQEAFGKNHADLYSLLGVKKEATSAQIKKGYHKAALKWHPDKNKQPDATLKFQALGEVHRILSDADLRSEYDESGEVPDSESATKMNWSAYFAKIFKVTTKDIDNFATEYVGSAEERADVLKFYVEGNGDLGFVIENVMLSSEADRERFEELIRTAIHQGEAQLLPLLDASSSSSAQAKKRRRKAQKEAALCEVPSDLLQQIQSRRQQRGSLLQQLEEKYGDPPPAPAPKGPKKGMKRPAAKR